MRFMEDILCALYFMSNLIYSSFLMDTIQGSFFSFLYKQSSAINLSGMFCRSVVKNRNERFDEGHLLLPIYSSTIQRTALFLSGRCQGFVCLSCFIYYSLICFIPPEPWLILTAVTVLYLAGMSTKNTLKRFSLSQTVVHP